MEECVPQERGEVMKKKFPSHAMKGRSSRRSRRRRGLLRPASSTLAEGYDQSEESQAALQRDSEPDDFDLGTNVADDRIRGAGGQSLAELVISKEMGWGLDEHGGGLRYDRPEPSVNDFDPDEPSQMDDDTLDEDDLGPIRGTSRIA